MVVDDNLLTTTGDGQVPEDYLSDDSDFYGPPSTIRALETTLRAISPAASWRIHASLPSVIAFNSLNQTSNLRDKGAGKGKSRLYHPFEGIASHLQPYETPSDFLARLPPLTTTLHSAGPWIWVDNPHAPHQNDGRESEAFEAQGTNLITAFRRLEARIREDMMGKVESTIGKKLTPARKTLESALRAAAEKTGFVSGKWMLFPQEEEVNRVWLRVCESVVAGQLGTAAKVGTAGTEMADGERVVCVYTKDFRDLVDVRRVLMALVDAGLVERDGGGKGIYYKSNAYTALGIDGKNEFKLKASMYGSAEMLKPGPAGKSAQATGVGKRKR